MTSDQPKPLYKRLLRLCLRIMLGLIVMALLLYLSLPYLLNHAAAPWLASQLGLAQLHIAAQRPSWDQWQIERIHIQGQNGEPLQQLLCQHIAIRYSLSQLWRGKIHSITIQSVNLTLQKAPTSDNSSAWGEQTLPLADLKSQWQTLLQQPLPDVQIEQLQLDYLQEQSTLAHAAFELSVSPQSTPLVQLQGQVIGAFDTTPLTLNWQLDRQLSQKLQIRQQSNQLDLQLRMSAEYWQLDSQLAVDDSLWQWLQRNRWLAEDLHITGPLTYQLAIQLPTRSLNLPLQQWRDQLSITGQMDSQWHIEEPTWGSLSTQLHINTTQTEGRSQLRFTDHSHVQLTLNPARVPKDYAAFVKKPIELAISTLSLTYTPEDRLQLEGAFELSTLGNLPWQLNLQLPTQDLWQQGAWQPLLWNSQFKQRIKNWTIPNSDVQIQRADLQLQTQGQLTWPTGQFDIQAQLNAQPFTLRYAQQTLPTLSLASQLQLQNTQLDATLSAQQAQQDLLSAQIHYQFAPNTLQADYQLTPSNPQLSAWLSALQMPLTMTTAQRQIDGKINVNLAQQQGTHSLNVSAKDLNVQSDPLTWQAQDLNVQQNLSFKKGQVRTHKTTVKLSQLALPSPIPLNVKTINAQITNLKGHVFPASTFSVSLEKIKYLNKIAPKMQDLQTQGQFDGDTLQLDATLLRLSKPLLHLSAQHNLRQQQGQATLSSQVQNITQWPHGLSDLAKGIDKTFTLTHGGWDLQSQLNWQQQDNAWQYSVNSQGRGHDWQGSVQQMPFKGFDWQLTTLDPKALSTQLALTLKRLGGEIALHDTQLDLVLNPLTPSVNIHTFQSQIFGGQLSAKPTDIPLNQAWQWTLDVQQLDLQQVLTAANKPGLSGEGRLSGRLPVHFHPAQGLSIQNGELYNQGSGVIHYQQGDYEKALAAQNSNTNIAFQALSNFQFTQLKVVLDHNRQQKDRTVSEWSFDGRNPDFYDGFPLKFNFNLDAPLVQMLQAGLLSSDIESSVEQRLQQKITPNNNE